MILPNHFFEKFHFNRAIMIHPPSPRHRKDGGPHEGGGEISVSAASTVPVVEKYCVQCGWGILLFVKGKK